MDNGSLTFQNENQLRQAYERVPKIFGNYKFNVQQVVTNCESLQNEIDLQDNTETQEDIKCFGYVWNRPEDSLSPQPLNLDSTAKTKRQILKSLNSVYDPFNIYAPLILRAKLFMQKLQTMKNLNWDQQLNEELINEWKLITNQTNKIPSIKISRSFGKRDDCYELILFSDASKSAFGIVIYVKDSLGKISFFMAKNRLLGSSMAKKSIPSLECQAVTFGVESLIEAKNRLAGSSIVIPVKISKMTLYTDSAVTLQWIRGFCINYEKQNNSVFVKNRLKKIQDLCAENPITFRHISGINNPADKVTKPCSYKTLEKSKYYEGADFMREKALFSDLEVYLPNLLMDNRIEACHVQTMQNDVKMHYDTTGIISIDKYSSLPKLINVTKNVIKFISILKKKASKNDLCNSQNMSNYYEVSLSALIRSEQRKYLRNVFDYFKNDGYKNQIPQEVRDFNLYIDENSIIRIKAKFREKYFHRIFLPRQSSLTKLLIRDTHDKLGHMGIYSVLSEMKKHFWIPRYFSIVKKILRECITCKRFNARPIEINQNSYRLFRSNPQKRPFANVFIDHIGPFMIKNEGIKKKVWILAITCLYTRAINLLIANSMDTKEFLRTIQRHVYKYGIFELCMSDLGSQIVSGSKIIKDFLSDHDTRKFFETR